MFLLLKKARYVIKNEGFPAFPRRSLLFIRRSIFFSTTYNLYTANLADTSREFIVPDIESLSLKIISNNREYEALSAAGFVFKPWKPEYRIRLDKGAIAVCAFSGKQLIHVSWSARTQEAMKSIKEPPYRIDFAHNEAANGDLWTHTKYRGKGIAHYVLRMRQQYLRENGVVTTRGAIPLDNQASLRVPRSGSSKVYATGRHIRFLWWHHWKETPYDGGAEQAGGEEVK